MHVWSLMSMLGVKSLYIHNGLCVVVKCYGESGVEGTIYGMLYRLLGVVVMMYIIMMNNSY